jgi:hypothetical protein
MTQTRVQRAQADPGARMRYDPNWRPDWREAERYEWLETRDSAQQFAWEFLRRNAKYQEVFKGIRHESDGIERESEVRQHDESVADYLKRLRETQPGGPSYLNIVLREFGLHKETFQSPSRNEPPVFQPLFDISLAGPVMDAGILDQIRVATVPPEDAPQTERWDFTLPLAAHQAAFSLDLRFPLAWQLSRLKEIFAGAQELAARDSLVEIVGKRLRADQYVGYLRLLDCVAVGQFDAKKIADVMSSDGARTLDEKAVAYDLAAARELQATGFRWLASVHESRRRKSRRGK